MYTTDMYEGMIAETVTIAAPDGESINAYFARPLGPGPYPGMVLAHHMPGWDEWYREATRKFAHHGYATICPDLYHRTGHASPEDVAAHVRSEGGISDDQAVGDLAASMQYLRSLPNSNGKIGAFGTCSGGRHVLLATSRVEGFDAVVDCWGGRVVMNDSEINEKCPVAPIDYTSDLSCPVLGLFGEEDSAPSPEQVTLHEEALKRHGKEYEFHMYPDAGHGFFYYDRSPYRQEQAVDGWQKVFAFLSKHLA